MTLRMKVWLKQLAMRLRPRNILEAAAMLLVAAVLASSLAIAFSHSAEAQGPPAAQYWGWQAMPMNTSNGTATACTLVTNGFGKCWLMLQVAPTNAAGTVQSRLKNLAGIGETYSVPCATNNFGVPTSLGDVWVIIESNGTTAASASLGLVSAQFRF
jgi:hypothetical protein